MTNARFASRRLAMLLKIRRELGPSPDGSLERDITAAEKLIRAAATIAPPKAQAISHRRLGFIAAPALVALAVLVVAGAATDTEAARRRPVVMQSPACGDERILCGGGALFGGPSIGDEIRRASRPRSKMRTAPKRSGLVTISCGGKKTRVAASAAKQFEGFCRDLKATGYKIDFVGGWRSWGTCAGCNMHPRGLALDVNQTGGRDRITRRFPPNVTALARKHGLLHGAVWGNSDTGHFEVAKYASAPKRKQWPIPAAALLSAPLPSPAPRAKETVLAHADPAHGLGEAPYERPALDPEPDEPVGPEIAYPPPPEPPSLVNLFQRYVASKEIVFKPWVVSVCPDDKPLPTRLTSMLKDAHEYFQARVLVNSAYRDRKYNRREGGARASQHIKCKAVDWRVAGVSSYRLLQWALKRKDITGHGYYGWSGHLHSDIRPAKQRVVWGISKKRYAKKRWHRGAA